MEAAPISRELLEAARSGDSSAFEHLARLFRPRVKAWARRMIADPDELDDVVQEVLIRLWTMLHSYRARGTVSAWLWTVTRNTALQRLRRRSSGPALIRGEGLPARLRSPDADALERACLRDLHGRVVAHLRHLPDQQRRACELVDELGYSPREAAEKLGVPSGTLRSSLCRARRAIRRAVEEEGWEAAG